MKKQYLLGFLLLLTSTIGMFSSGVYAAEPIDSDGDGVPDNLDQCPHLLEDYDSQYGNNIDGCPADFVPWYDADFDGIQDHLDDCPTVRETYNMFEDEDGC
ncbi:MAG: thrombospondin type 3 repeat-containing protein, partial [Nitrosopumilus sp.]